MKRFTPVVLVFAVAAWGQAAPSPKGRGAGRVDMSSLVSPIAPHDTVFLEAMTQIEIRDALKAGKTTALLFVGGMEGYPVYRIPSLIEAKYLTVSFMPTTPPMQ